MEFRVFIDKEKENEIKTIIEKNDLKIVLDHKESKEVLKELKCAEKFNFNLPF